MEITERATSERRSFPFPAEWGTPPDDPEKRTGWIRAQIRAGILAFRSEERPSWRIADIESMNGRDALGALMSRADGP